MVIKLFGQIKVLMIPISQLKIIQTSKFESVQNRKGIKKDGKNKQSETFLGRLKKNAFQKR